MKLAFFEMRSGAHLGSHIVRSTYRAVFSKAWSNDVGGPQCTEYVLTAEYRIAEETGPQVFICRSVSSVPLSSMV